MKVKIFNQVTQSEDLDLLEEQINEFIKDKTDISIQYLIEHSYDFTVIKNRTKNVNWLIAIVHYEEIDRDKMMKYIKVRNEYDTIIGARKNDQNS